MRKQALSLIGTFAVVIAASIVASAALDVSKKSISQGGARRSSTEEGQQLDGRAERAKPLDNITTTPCASSYTMHGGSSAEYRGRYNKGPAAMVCNGNAVYIQQRSDPYYLINLWDPYGGPGEWMVTDETGMRLCNPGGYIVSANQCTCPEKCISKCPACGSFGAWQEATGASDPLDPTFTATCNATYESGANRTNGWCDSGIWWV